MNSPHAGIDSSFNLRIFSWMSLGGGSPNAVLTCVNGGRESTTGKSRMYVILSNPMKKEAVFGQGIHT